MSQSDLFKSPNSTAKITLYFNEHLVKDPDAIFGMYYTDNWNTGNSKNVIDVEGNAIEGIILTKEQTFIIPITQPFTEIIVTAIGLHLAQYTFSKYVFFDAPENYEHRIWVTAMEEEYYGPLGGDDDYDSDPVDPNSDLKDNNLI